MPPFFIPILAFIIWAAVVFSFIPVLKLDLYLSEQFIAAQFFILSFILVLAWPFSGPLVAAILSILSASVAVYLALGTKEASYFLTPVVNAVLFFWMAVYLQRAQRKTKDLSILNEKLSEDLNLTAANIRKTRSRKVALQKKIDNFLDLERFSEELKGENRLEAIGAKMVQKAREVLPDSESCELFLVDESEQGLKLLAMDGDALSGSESTPIDLWVMKRGQAVMIEDVRNDFRFASEEARRFGSLRSACAIPLVTENRVLGVMRSSSSLPKRFSADDSRLLDIFSSFGAVTLRNLLLYERTEELGSHDSLTGLNVNRVFQERLEEAVKKASSYEKVIFSMILLDIDFFKKYNDEYGHAAGDLVLKTIADLLKKITGSEGLAARYGGEEFAVLLPGKDKRTAFHEAERIRAEIERKVFVLRRVERRVTASFGVAGYAEDGRTRDEILWACDKYLYEAKKTGRNRVCGGT